MTSDQTKSSRIPGFGTSRFDGRYEDLCKDQNVSQQRADSLSVSQQAFEITLEDLSLYYHPYLQKLLQEVLRVSLCAAD